MTEQTHRRPGQERQVPVLDRKGLREFGLVTGGVFALLFGLFFPWLLGFAYPLWPWILFAVLALAAWLAPGILRPVHTVWMRMALGISKLTTPIILGVVFFALFWPLGLIARLFRKDPMRRKMDSGLTSYRIESRQSGKNDLENPY